jgi:hypothetical protein
MIHFFPIFVVLGKKLATSELKNEMRIEVVFIKTSAPAASSDHGLLYLLRILQQDHTKANPMHELPA